MSKGKIRKKASPKQLKVMGHDHPDIFSFPYQMVGDELICIKCENGWMRPSDSKIVSGPENGPNTIVHVCTNPECSNSQAIPFPPFPRVHPVPMVSPDQEGVFEFLRGQRKARREFEAVQREANDAK